ncbi:hypothetical protein AAHA92_03344 [Salvia divinorum]|uniref:Uncharacterized protein n=1 Tax=Salvia divinorum TaxID=28513 RepID=A0ABD1IGT7_SALDI
MNGLRSITKKRGAYQETQHSQGLPHSPPSILRCRTRSSTLVTPQLSLRPALRVLREDIVVPKLEFPTRDDPVSTSPSPLIQHNPDIDDPFQLQSEMALVAYAEPIQEKCKTYDGPSSNRCLSPSHSLNLTEFARGLGDDDDDEDEVESAPSVHGHKVKAEIAPLVGAIFDTYGDITANSNVKSPSIMASFFLERLCDVYQRLEKTRFQDITRAEINDMLDELHQYQAQKFNVEWLLEKVKQISEVRRSSTKSYLAFKGEATKCIKANERMGQEIQQNRRHIALIQKKISAIEKAMEANKAGADNYTKMALDIKVKVKALASQSLVHGLL